MDSYIFKTCVTIPYCYKFKKYDHIEENDYFKKSPIGITYGKDAYWINNNAMSLFTKKVNEKSEESNKKTYIKRYALDGGKYKEFNLLQKNKSKKVYYISNMSDYKFAIDDIYVWVMRSGCAFVSFIITFNDTTENGIVFSDEIVEKIIYKLQDRNTSIRYQKVEAYNKQTGQKTYTEKKIKLQNIAENILKKIDITYKDNKPYVYKDKNLMLNYIVTDDEKSDDAKRLLEVIDSNLNPDSIVDTVDEVDKRRYYFQERYRWLWLCSKHKITMIGSSESSKLVDRSISNSIFDKHLCLYLYYYNIYMVCNLGGKKLIRKDGWKIVKKMLKCENKPNKEEIKKRIKKEYPKDKNEYLKSNKNRYIGGIAKTDIKEKKHLNDIYVYHYAVQELQLIKELTECFNKDVFEIVRIYVFEFILEILLILPKIIKNFVEKYIEKKSKELLEED